MKEHIRPKLELKGTVSGHPNDSNTRSMKIL